MRDVELYRYLLGLLPPWTVERVDLSVKDGQVDGVWWMGVLEEVYDVI